MKIYLAGSVPKGGEEEKTFVNWRFIYKEVLEKFLDAEFIQHFHSRHKSESYSSTENINTNSAVSKEESAEFIFPNSGDMDESDYLLIVGKDSKSIKESDLVIVNAEERLGAGTSMEMVIAKYFKKPVIVVMPKNSHHRRANVMFQNKYFVEDWMHPFIHTFADFIVEKVEEIEKLKDIILSTPVKDITIIDKAIQHRSKF